MKSLKNRLLVYLSRCIIIFNYYRVAAKTIILHTSHYNLKIFRLATQKQLTTDCSSLSDDSSIHFSIFAAQKNKICYDHIHAENLT